MKSLKSAKMAAASLELVNSFLEKDRLARSGTRASNETVELSSNSIALLRNIESKAISKKKEVVSTTLATARQLAHDIEDLQRALAATPKEDSIKDAAEASKLASQEFALIDQQAKKLNAELDVERASRVQLEEQARRLRKKIVDEGISNEEDTRLVKLLTRTQETMKLFLERATANKIERLAEFITESFRFLLRKKALVNRVVIDPATFDIQLEDAAGKRISKQQLSEGEKQILQFLFFGDYHERRRVRCLR